MSVPFDSLIYVLTRYANLVHYGEVLWACHLIEGLSPGSHLALYVSGAKARAERAIVLLIIMNTATTHFMRLSTISATTCFEIIEHVMLTADQLFEHEGDDVRFPLQVAARYSHEAHQILAMDHASLDRSTQLNMILNITVMESLKAAVTIVNLIRQIRVNLEAVVGLLTGPEQ